MIKDYLPNKENMDTSYMDRSFVFSVVNTLEPTFFERCLQQYHDKIELQKTKVAPKVEITNEMMEVLEGYIKTSWRKRPLKGSRAGLFQLREDRKLKNRDKEKEREKRELNKINFNIRLLRKRKHE